jgi:hypothetical protein
MDAKLIEKLDKRRYRYLLYTTIGAVLYMPGLIFDRHMVENKAVVEFILGATSFIGFAMIIGFAIAAWNNARTIKSDPDLKAALNNEMVRLYNHKSMKWAAGTALIVSFLMDVLARWFIPEISIHGICMTIYFSTALAGAISRLIYMKTRG